MTINTRQILTSKVGPRAERVNQFQAETLFLAFYSVSTNLLCKPCKLSFRFFCVALYNMGIIITYSKKNRNTLHAPPVFLCYSLEQITSRCM